MKPRMYGGILNKRPEDPSRCIKPVPDGTRCPDFYQCARKRGFGLNGEYCKQHDPEAVKKREEIARQKYHDKYIRPIHDREERRNKQEKIREDLLSAVKAQHEAIDILFALLIEKDPTFFPSKSGKPWQAILQGNEAIKLAEGKS